MPMESSTKHPTMTRILFPSDLSPPSQRAFGHVRLLSERFGARVKLYHAVELPFRDYVRWAGYEEDVLEARARLAARARGLLEQQAASLAVPYEVAVEDDLPAAAALVDLAIRRLIERDRPDLVVMATHSRGAIGSLFLGSVTQQVVQHAGGPVLCVGPGDGSPAQPYRRIVVPTDFSDLSCRAFPIAALLAHAFAAEIIATYVVPRPSATKWTGDAAPAAGPTAGGLRDFVKEFHDIKVTPRIEQGAAWDRIIAVVEETKADLIVMSTRGADSLSENILGGQTERVIRRAACPVLAV